MAPEIEKGGHVTCNADVYSFGCMLIEIMSEKELSKGEDNKPINIESPQGKKWNIVLIDLEVKNLIDKCLKNRKCRPDIREVCETINSWNPDKW